MCMYRSAEGVHVPLLDSVSVPNLAMHDIMAKLGLT